MVLFGWYTHFMNVEKIIREYLTKTVHMSLASVRDNKPWVCEVHFAYDDDLNLYFRSLTSRRHSQEIADNPNVAGNIVQQYELEVGCDGAISFEGAAELMTDPAEREKVTRFFEAQLKPNKDILKEAEDPEGHQFYKITVSTWYAYGKFEGDTSAKQELPWNGGQK